jgi:hypothetical protein
MMIELAMVLIDVTMDVAMMQICRCDVGCGHDSDGRKIVDVAMMMKYVMKELATMLIDVMEEMAMMLKV